MAFPDDPLTAEVGLFIDDAWVDAVTVGDGVRENDRITVTRGSSDWAPSVDPTRAGFTFDNSDGRWSPDNASGPYFGQFRRNIRCRVGRGTGNPSLQTTGLSADVASTPDVLGAGGGAPTAPTFVSSTQSAETNYVGTHDCSLPATLAAGDRLLLLAHAGHESLTPADQGGGVTDLDDWTLVDASNLYVPWDAFAIYEIGPLTAAQATALAGGTVQFSTTTGARSSFQVIRTSGCRAGGQGVAWDYALDPPPRTFGSTPNPPSLTAPWGADEHRWYAIAWYASNGESATGAPWVTNYTNVADGNTTALVQIATAHRTTSAATEDPGTFTLSGNENWLAMTFVYRAPEDTTGDGVLDISGDIDLRIGGQLFRDLVDIVQGGSRVRLAHKNAGGDGWEWEMYNALGAIVSNFTWYSSTGARNVTSEATGSAIPLSVLWSPFGLRVTLDADNGAGGHDVAYYTSDSIGGVWAQVGSTVTTAGTTDIITNDAPLKVAGNGADVVHIPFPGRVDDFEMLDGIDGTKVADIDFTLQAIGSTSFTGTDGLPWTLAAGGRITDMSWRFHGELSSIPVRNNLDASDVWVPAEAQGLFRRLRQGNRRLDSVIKKAILMTAEGLIQYWPMEEVGNFVSSFGAAKGIAPMQVVGGFPKAGASATFLASEPIPEPDATTFVATVDAYPATDAWQIRWLQSIPDDFTGTDLQYMIVSTTDMTWIVTYRDNAGGQHQLLAFRGATLVYDSGWFSLNATGTNRRMTLSVVQNGASVDAGLEGQAADEPSASGFFNTAVVAGSAGAVTQIRISRNKDIPDWGIGHVTLQNLKTPSTELSTELNAYTAEPAGARIVRLCLQEGIASRIQGDPADTEPMGPQPPGTLVGLLRECASTDLGILGEAPDSVAVSYRTRTSITDQTPAIAIDAAVGELGGPLRPDRDDQGFANDVEVVNRSGTTARAVLDDGSPLSISEPPDGVGSYDDQLDVNCLDPRLWTLANSVLEISTVDEPRVSTLPINLESPALASNASLTDDVLSARLGDRATVANNLSTVLPNVDLIIRGLKEEMNSFRHRFEMFTSPAAPWLSGGVTPPPAERSVTFRTQLDLAYPGSPAHVLTALGYTDTAKITRAQLDGILDDWVTSTGGTTHLVTSSPTWDTAMTNAQPGDLVRLTASPGVPLNARHSRFSLTGANMTNTGQPGLPIILTCADGVFNDCGNTSNGDVGLDLQNTTHVWAVGFNVKNSQFGIRAQNWGGTAGFPAYRAYCRTEDTGDNAFQAQGWFQSIASSPGGVIPTDPDIASPGVDWGYSEYFVDESNVAVRPGRVNLAFGEGFYYGTGTSGGGWHGFCRDFYVRGNHTEEWTSDGYDTKPGCHRGYETDNTYTEGFAVSGAPFQLCLVVAANSSRPAWFNFDPEIWVEGNRGWDSNITNTNVSSDNIMGYVGLSGIRIANCVSWANPQTATHSHWRFRNFKGTNDTEAIAEFRTDPTWVVNCTTWGDDSVELAGYGATPTAFPTAILNAITLRNNIVDQATPATGEVDASASDFVATVPAIGVAGDAEWETYGPGSAFDLDPGSALVRSGASIADIDLLIDRDISNRPIPDPLPNPGAFQPFPV